MAVAFAEMERKSNVRMSSYFAHVRGISSTTPKKAFDLIDSERWVSSMGDGMAIWTERNEVIFRIDHVVAPQLADRHDVMDLDVPFRLRAVYSSEVHAAGKAGTTVYRKRSSSVAPVPFVAVYLNYLDGTLRGRLADHPE